MGGMPNVLPEAQCLDVKCISSDCYTGPRELNKKDLISLYIKVEIIMI